MSFPAGKFTDYDACNLGRSRAAQVWVAEVKGWLNGMMRSRDIAGVSTIQSRSACAKTENPGDLSDEASIMTITRRSDAAIELVLMLWLVFHLALRQAEGFVASILQLLGQEVRVPDHTTLSRRSYGFAGRRPKVIPHGPMPLVINSTGLKLFGQGEWEEEKHGRARRSWRKLHLAIDADAGEIVAVGRYKAIIGPKLRARILQAQQGETAIATEVLNHMIRVAKPASLCAT